MEEKVFLTAEKALELEARAAERMSKICVKDSLAEKFGEIATKAAIITLQEYERMKADANQKE